MTDLDYNYIGELAERAKYGDSDAFAELYAATYQKQYLFAYSYLKDEYLAQDAIQEAYIAALKGINSLKDPKLFISWLNQITLHVCITMSKKMKNHIAEVENFSSEDIEYIPASEPDPETIAVTIDNNRFILNEVMSLPYSESQAIFLKYYKNMDIDDIAFIMEISRSSVKRYLASGKKRLAKTIR